VDILESNLAGYVWRKWSVAADTHFALLLAPGGGESMKCPLLLVQDIQMHDNQLTDVSDCLQAECAWWNSFSQVCSLVKITDLLRDIALAAESVSEKIPHEAQFRK